MGGPGQPLATLTPRLVAKTRTTPASIGHPAPSGIGATLSRIRARSQLERRDLVVDLGSVVQAVLVPAGSREDELHAVAAHAVVAGVERRATDGPDRAVRVCAAPD